MCTERVYMHTYKRQRNPGLVIAGTLAEIRHRFTHSPGFSPFFSLFDRRSLSAQKIRFASIADKGSLKKFIQRYQYTYYRHTTQGGIFYCGNFDRPCRRLFRKIIAIVISVKTKNKKTKRRDVSSPTPGQSTLSRTIREFPPVDFVRYDFLISPSFGSSISFAFVLFLKRETSRSSRALLLTFLKKLVALDRSSMFKLS